MRVLPKGPIQDVAALRRALQAAIEVEHATIPPYLTALFSIVPGENVEVAAALQGIAREEMLHMALAANVLNAVGGRPAINTPDFIPPYPGPLPWGVHPGLELRIAPCSMEQLELFATVEHPMYAADSGNTISGFYTEILKAIERLDDGTLFQGDPKRQVTGWEGPGTLVHVTNQRSAKRAIEEIMRQGEGASAADPFDEQGELAHYYRLREIIEGRRLIERDGKYVYGGDPIPFDPAGVWPMKADPKTSALEKGSLAHSRSLGFDTLYVHLLNVLQEVFDGEPERLRASIGLMYGLKVEAQTLLQTPLDPNGDPRKGPNAGPSFGWTDAHQDLTVNPFPLLALVPANRRRQEQNFPTSKVRSSLSLRPEEH